MTPAQRASVARVLRERARELAKHAGPAADRGLIAAKIVSDYSGIIDFEGCSEDIAGEIAARLTAEAARDAAGHAPLPGARTNVVAREPATNGLREMIPPVPAPAPTGTDSALQSDRRRT